MRILLSRNVSYLRVGLHPSQLLDVARPAEQVVVQGVTALVGLVGELHLTTLKCVTEVSFKIRSIHIWHSYFADVTVDVKVLFHRHHSNRLLGPLKERLREFADMEYKEVQRSQ